MWHPSLVDQPVRGLCSTAGKICGCESKRSIEIGEILDRGSSIGSTVRGDHWCGDGFILVRCLKRQAEGKGDWTATNS